MWNPSVSCRDFLRAAMFVAACLLLPPSAAAQAPVSVAVLTAPGHVLLMRHAHAPGTGDPANMRIGDCATQRNLDETGRAQARAMGARLRDAGIGAARLLSSEWCRCVETAENLALGPVATAPAALNSFFADRTEQPESTAALRALLDGLPRDGGLAILVTHMVNITALTGIVPVSGESVVLRLSPGGGFAVVGRLPAAL